MDDGLVLRADVFRLRRKGAIRDSFLWAYGKGLAFQEATDAWEIMAREYRTRSRHSNQYANGRWSILKVGADGYICVRVDSRGADARRLSCHNNTRETPTSTVRRVGCGASVVQRKVGMNGISY